jgi:hypothetical protein
MKLLSIDTNPKTIKGTNSGYLTGILYMYPNAKTCPHAEIAGCSAWKHGLCLVNAGLAGVYKSVNIARQRKTDLFFGDKSTFFDQLIKDIQSLVKRAAKQELIPVVRLNGTSDIRYEDIIIKDNKNIFELFPTVQFYDYTKISGRLNHGFKNYDLTFSYSAKTEYAKQVTTAIEFKSRIAVVFNKKIPLTFLGLDVIDGDKHDLRFTEQRNVVVGLVAKGKARNVESDFVINAI